MGWALLTLSYHANFDAIAIINLVWGGLLIISDYLSDGKEL